MRMTKLPALAILIPAVAGMAGVLQASAYDLYGDGTAMRIRVQSRNTAPLCRMRPTNMACAAMRSIWRSAWRKSTARM
jgi:hypothetical protein